MAVYPGLEADTIALFRLDETARGDYTLNDAGSNARHMTTEVGTITSIIPGPRSYQGTRAARTQGCLARRNRAITAIMKNGNIGGDAATLQGNWTFKGWVYLDNLAVNQAILQYGAIGETQVTNIQLQFYVDTSGRLHMFWENGAGLNSDTATSIGATFTAGAWHHVAVKKETNGGNKQLTFYLDGVKLQTVTGITNADGGSSSQWVLGEIGLTNSFIGNCRSLMVTSNLSSDADIAADAANTTGANAYTHTDTNVIVHYKCDELPDAWDDAGNFHLRMVAVSDPPGTVGGTFTVASPLIADGGQGKYFNGGSTTGTGTEFQSSTYLNSILLAAIAGGMSIELWFRSDDGNAPVINRPFVCIGNPGPETQADNYLSCHILNTTGQAEVDWEHGAGVNSTATAPSALLTAITVFSSHYIRFDLCPESGQMRVYMTLDGTQFYTSGLLTVFDGGTNDILRVGAGTNSIALDPNEAGFKGIIDHVRISNACHQGDTTYADSVAASGIAVAIDQDVFKNGESRRVTAKIGTYQADGTFTAQAADSGTVRYFLFRQEAAGSGLTLLNSGGTLMTDVSSGSLTDWEATITFASANAHVVVVSCTVGGLAVTSPGQVVAIPPKFYFDPTGLFS